MTKEKLRELERKAETGDSLAQKLLEIEKSRLDLEPTIRQMKLEVEGTTVYESTFNLLTGTITRKHLTGQIDKYSYDRGIPSWNKCLNENFVKSWNDRFSETEEYEDRSYTRLLRERSFSPVPETIDLAINTWCNFGCDFCYMDATVKGQHMSLELLEKIIKGFDEPPYQMAFGGGSPTHHPEFTEVLRLTRQWGVVPNYTTEGQNLTDKVLAATERYCGGVALTYHAWRGFEVFEKAYDALKSALPYKQINVHVIADKDVVENLERLNTFKRHGPMNIVLLAYYPDVGRSDLSGLMNKSTFMEKLPKTIQKLKKSGHRFAISEGMIPYFLSRPEIGIDMSMATPVEGHFSCYFDINGRLSYSSFKPPHYRAEDEGRPANDFEDSAYNTKSQDLWTRLGRYHIGTKPNGVNCDNCAKQGQCSVPDTHHYFICNYAKHNNPDSQPTIGTKFSWPRSSPKEAPYQISVVQGFITNSSSAIYHFDARVLEHPMVKHFIEAYEIQNGYVGDNLWYRSACDTFAITPEQKAQAQQDLESINAEEWYQENPASLYFFNQHHPGPIVIYGDEYPELTYHLGELMEQASRELNLPYSSDEYN